MIRSYWKKSESIKYVILDYITERLFFNFIKDIKYDRLTSKKGRFT